MGIAEDELKLCYVSASWAWFTSRELSDQWGDDWDDAPYELNAGPPYESDGDDYRIVKVAFDGPLEELAQARGHEAWSVEQINARCAPWLATWGHPEDLVVWAGTTLPEFRTLIEQSGGHVYEIRESAAPLSPDA